MDAKLPKDFKEFLQLLYERKVEYLLIGGYAVITGTTGDIDIWIAINQANAERMIEVLRQFGFDMPDLTPKIFLTPQNIVRMGYPPSG